MRTALFQELSRRVALSDLQLEALEHTFSDTITVAGHSDFISEGQSAPFVFILLEGLAWRYKMLPDGRRAILAINLPGDVVGLDEFMLKRINHSVGAITQCKIAKAPYSAIEALIQRHPTIALALWREALMASAACREWLAGLGRRSAYERTAHLFCEISHRMRTAGLNQGDSFRIPLTQADLADALGLSGVHMNRTLQKLRTDGLIRYRAGILKILDGDNLARAGGFDPAYLSPCATTPPVPAREVKQPLTGSAGHATPHAF